MVSEEPAPAFGVHLRPTGENVREIEALRRLVGEAAGIDGLLDDLKWLAHRSPIPRLLGRAVDTGIAWNRFDQRDPRWWPQGISTSADASDTEEIAGRRVLVTTWYSKADHGSRLTFLDLDTLRYRHVLLVDVAVDEHGELQLKPLKIHAGGIVWAGPWLHVAATARGFVTFRVDDLTRIPDDHQPAGNDRPDEFGVYDGRVSSYGHRYVLPVRFRYRASADEGHQELRYSFLSLDRRADEPALIAGEYGRGGQSTRLARFPLDPATWLPAIDEDGHSRPLVLEDGGLVQMQGASLVGGRYHVTVSHGPWTPGSVYVGTPGSFARYRFALPMGPEDIAWWPSTDRFWSLTEHPRRRWVVSMRRDRFGSGRG